MGKLTLNAEVQDKWEDLMQEGYTFSMKGDSVGAARLWSELWENMNSLLISDPTLSIEDLDAAFHGQQSLYNWTSDFEMELGNASKEDTNFAQTRIQFCSTYIARYKDKSESNLEGMKWATCESYFGLGEAEEGERLFQTYLEESPTLGWGWACWSDQYSSLSNKNNKDNEKAIQILKKALEVEGLQDRFHVLERLDDLLMEMGRVQESAEIRQKMIDEIKVKNVSRPRGVWPPLVKAVPVTSIKIGRNDPCTCGSGLKYKKCCGK